jgi:hypothetical protein
MSLISGFKWGVTVAKDLSAQIGDRGEDAAGEIVSLDFGKPQFDLVQPRRIRGR